MSQDQRDLREMVEELLQLENDELTEWEASFIDDMDGWRGPYSTRQAQTIQRIYEERL